MRYSKKLKYQLRTRDFDENDYFKYSSLLDIFQDISAIHATELGVSFTRFKEEGLFWVIPRMRVVYFDQPKQEQAITVKTYISKSDNPYEYRRDYLVYNKARLLIAYASSIWVLIDAKTRSLTKRELYKNNSRLKPKVEDISKLKFQLTPDFVKGESYRVLPLDIDHNGHLNNTLYLDICSNSSHLSFTPYHHLNIDFLGEAKEGDLLDVYYLEQDQKLYFVIVNDGKKIAKLELF